MGFIMSHIYIGNVKVSVIFEFFPIEIRIFKDLYRRIARSMIPFGIFCIFFHSKKIQSIVCIRLIAVVRSFKAMTNKLSYG